MIIDASAIIALIDREPGHVLLIEKALRSSVLVIGAPTLLEATIVAIGRLGPEEGKKAIREAMKELNPEVAPFDQTLYEEAVKAVELFGKGRHPAALNFGDCMVFALAKARKLPVLCTGDDFAKAGVAVA